MDVNLSADLRYRSVNGMAHLTCAMVFVMTKAVPVRNALGSKRKNCSENEKKKRPAGDLP